MRFDYTEFEPDYSGWSTGFDPPRRDENSPLISLCPAIYGLAAFAGLSIGLFLARFFA